MDAQALAIAAAIALIAALAAAVIIVARHNARLEAELDAGLELERERTRRLENLDAALSSARDECRALERELEQRDRALAQVNERRGELTLELEHLGNRRGLQEGELVVVNTRKPDDQSLEGIVLRELPDGGIQLAGAELLVAPGGRGRAGEVERLAAGEVFIPSGSVGWVQRHVTPRPSPRQRAEAAAQS